MTGRLRACAWGHKGGERLQTVTVTAREGEHMAEREASNEQRGARERCDWHGCAEARPAGWGPDGVPF